LIKLFLNICKDTKKLIFNKEVLFLFEIPQMFRYISYRHDRILYN